MSKIFVFAIMLCCPVLAMAQPQGSQTTLVRIFSYSTELRQAAENGDFLGLDFDFRYEVMRQPATQDPQGNQFNFVLSATGFQDFDREVAELDHMRAEIAVAGRYYRSGMRPLDPFQQVRFGELFERDGKGDSLTSAEEKELNDLARRATSNRLYFSYGAHYRFETTQDVTTKQHVVGVAVSGELPMLHELLDMVAESLGPRYSGYRSQPVRVYLGFDYVVKQEGNDRISEGEVKGRPRARLEAAWKTLILDEIVLRTTLEAQYLFKAPAYLKTEKHEFNSFFQVWVERPLSQKFGVLAKLAHGRLPPLYANTSEGKIGFRISLN